MGFYFLEQQRVRERRQRLEAFVPPLHEALEAGDVAEVENVLRQLSRFVRRWVAVRALENEYKERG